VGSGVSLISGAATARPTKSQALAAESTSPSTRPADFTGKKHLKLQAHRSSRLASVGPSPFSGVKSEGGGGVGREVGAASRGQRDGEVGNIYHLFEKKGGIPSIVLRPFPYRAERSCP
jgi:hypothetical protein